MNTTMRIRYIYALIRVNNAVEEAVYKAHIDIAKMVGMAMWRIWG